MRVLRGARASAARDASANSRGGGHRQHHLRRHGPRRTFVRGFRVSSPTAQAERRRDGSSLDERRARVCARSKACAVQFARALYRYTPTPPPALAVIAPGTDRRLTHARRCSLLRPDLPRVSDQGGLWEISRSVYDLNEKLPSNSVLVFRLFAHAQVRSKLAEARKARIERINATP